MFFIILSLFWFLLYGSTVRALYVTHSQSQPDFKTFFSSADAMPILCGKTSESRAELAVARGILTHLA
jgi:hypothetical protein